MTVFIQKGDAPLSLRQGTKRGLQLFEAEKMQYEREAGLLMGSQEYVEWANGWMNDNKTNAANNMFNHALTNYRKATARLAQYALADGRAEQTFEEPSGEYDEEGNEIMHVWIQPAIDPLEPNVEQNVYDDEGNLTGTETVANPLIVADEAERAAAQSVVDGTPEEVKAW